MLTHHKSQVQSKAHAVKPANIKFAAAWSEHLTGLEDAQWRKQQNQKRSDDELHNDRPAKP